MWGTNEGDPGKFEDAGKVVVVNLDRASRGSNESGGISHNE
jgi:hypothetical protein